MKTNQNMAASGKIDQKLTLEIRTKSVEQTLVPLVTQVNVAFVHWLVVLHINQIRILISVDSPAHLSGTDEMNDYYQDPLIWGVRPSVKKRALHQNDAR